MADYFDEAIGKIPSGKQFGYTQLSPVEEKDFQTDFRRSPWFKGFVERFKEEPYMEGDYDYRGAWKAGLLPQEEDAHWLSSDPKSGKWFKSPTHPTAWKEVFMRGAGFDPDSAGIDRAKASELMMNPSLLDDRQFKDWRQTQKRQRR